MAFREVTMIEIREVVRQWLGGRGVKTVARTMGIDPKTARRYIRAAEEVGFVQSEGIEASTTSASSCCPNTHGNAILARSAATT